jgi:hypothetical protein
MKTKDALDLIRQHKRRAYLAGIAATCNHAHAAKAANVSRSNHYLWLREPEYAAAFKIAWERGIDFLEAEAVRRATEGTRKPVFHAGRRAMDLKVDENGEVVYKRDKDGVMKAVPVPAFIVEKSDTLLMFLLNGARPQTYRQRTSMEHTGADGKPLFGLAQLDELIDRYRADKPVAAADKYTMWPGATR